MQNVQNIVIEDKLLLYYPIFKFETKKKEHIIIIAISSYMGPMYIETLYINLLQLFWEGFEWFCLQISRDAKCFPSLVEGIVIENQ